MSQPYDHIKQAGFVTDNAGKFIGSGLGVGASLGMHFGLGVDDNRLTVALPVILGGALGSIVDWYRINKKLKNKDMTSYRFSAKELKGMGFSKEQIDELLKHPLHVKSAELEVKDKELALFRPVSSTVGKLFDIPLKTILDVNTETAGLDQADIKSYIDSVKNHPGLQNVAVHLGSGRLLSRLGRAWMNDRNDFLDKLHYTATLPMSAAMTALTRADHFDPVSNTVTVYHGAPSILAHELGHALDYNTAKDPDTWRQMYFMKSPVNQEYLASNLAVNQLAKNLLRNSKKPKNKKELEKLVQQADQLYKALGTYRSAYGDQKSMTRIRDREVKVKKNPLELLLTNEKDLKKLKTLLKKHKVNVK